MQSTPLQISKPCHENWDAMSPNERGRHCASCNKTVIDLTAMPAQKAADYMSELATSLRTEPGTHVCVRAHADPRGFLVKPGRGTARRLLLTNGLAAILAVSMAGCGGNGPSGVKNTTPTDTHATLTADPQPIAGAASVGQMATPQTMMGAPAPTPRVFMGDVCEPQATMGEAEVCPQPAPEPRELLGKVAAPAIKGEVSAPIQGE